MAGATSTIAAEFVKLLRVGTEMHWDRLCELEADRYDYFLICTGYLAGKSLSCLSADEADRTWRHNFLEPARFCDRVFGLNPSARVCLIGSRSGLVGSFDMAYAGAKAALHLYVQTKRLEPSQSLTAIVPTVIWDTHMTQRRTDLAELEARGARTLRGRWLTAAEVAVEAHRALFALGPFPSKSERLIHMECGE